MTSPHLFADMLTGPFGWAQQRWTSPVDVAQAMHQSSSLTEIKYAQFSQQADPSQSCLAHILCAWIWLSAFLRSLSALWFSCAAVMPLHHEIRLAGRLDAIRPPARCRTNDMCNDLPSEKSGAVSMCGESHLAVLLQAIT